MLRDRRSGCNTKSLSRLTIRIFLPFLSSVVLFFAIDKSYGQKDRSSPPTVSFFSSVGKNLATVQVELPKSKEAFEQGLMFRQSLPKNHGMFFIFAKPRPVAFWMHNTSLSLDMIFLDEHMQVVWIEEDATPFDDTPRGPLVPTQFVLEVLGGFARSHGIRIGTKAKFLDAIP